MEFVFLYKYIQDDSKLDLQTFGGGRKRENKTEKELISRRIKEDAEMASQ